MKPLQLFTSRPAFLAVQQPDGSLATRLVSIRSATEELRFEHDLQGGPATVRVEHVWTASFEGVALRQWAEARGTLHSGGLTIEALRTETSSLAGLEAGERRGFVSRLWRRGLEGDAFATDALLDAHPDPVPEPFVGPPGLRMRATLTSEQREQAVELLVPTYWNEGVHRERVAAAVHASPVCVGALDGSGRLVGHARAIADRTKYAWVYDVVVSPEHRGVGLGQALMRLLLDHPLVRDAFQVLLATRDAQTLYAKFGFVDRKLATPLRSWSSTEMVLRRVR